MKQKILNYGKKLILTVAVFSIYAFLFRYLGASDGEDVYLGICATIIILGSCLAKNGTMLEKANEI